MAEIGINGFEKEYNTDRKLLDAEIAVNSETNEVLDLRLNDLRNRIANVPKYDIGLSEWLLKYKGDDNRNVMDIYLQDRLEDYITYVGDSEYRVYLSDLKEHWIERYGEESWHDAEFDEDDGYPSFDEIDSDIQAEHPGLYFESRELNYFNYTTELKYAYGMYIKNPD